MSYHHRKRWRATIGKPSTSFIDIEICLRYTVFESRFMLRKSLTLQIIIVITATRMLALLFR